MQNVTFLKKKKKPTPFVIFNIRFSWKGGGGVQTLRESLRDDLTAGVDSED